jgi:dTMP kinase
MPFKGHFITLEGGEGAGKSTLIQSLSEELSRRGYAVITTREPGGTHLGETIRGWLLSQDHAGKIFPNAELLLFLAARTQHIHEVILPALEAGKMVFCDRFNDSTVAYQGCARGLGVHHVSKLCELTSGNAIPELTLFLNLPPIVGLERSRKVHKDQASSGELDRIESEHLSFHEKIQQGFLLLAKKDPFRIYTIDATRSVENVFKEAMRAIEELVLLPDGASKEKS